MNDVVDIKGVRRKREHEAWVKELEDTTEWKLREAVWHAIKEHDPGPNDIIRILLRVVAHITVWNKLDPEAVVVGLKAAIGKQYNIYDQTYLPEEEDEIVQERRFDPRA